MENLRENEVFCTITEEEANEIDVIQAELKANRQLIAAILEFEKQALIKSNAFWRKIGKKYFLEIATNSYHIDLTTRAVKIGKPPSMKT